MTEEPEVTAAPEPAAPEPAEPQRLSESLESILGETFDKIEARDRLPERAEGGKFVSKNPPAAAPTEATPVTENTDQPATTESETAKPSIAPPESWSAENKAKFAALPPDVQAYIAQREGEAHKAITQKGEELKRFEPFARVLDPHRERIQRLGVDPTEYVGRILHAESLLQNPQTRVQAIQQIARDYGVDLSALTGQPAGQMAQSAQDPALAAALEKVNRLETWATQRERQEMEAANARAQAAAREAEARATAFLNDPKYPYAKELESDMSALIIAERALGRELSLEDAYKRASRASETVWQKIEAEKAAAAKKEADEAAAKKAAEAKRKAPTNVKPRGSGATAPSSAKTWEERIGEAYDRIQGAA